MGFKLRMLDPSRCHNRRVIGSMVPSRLNWLVFMKLNYYNKETLLCTIPI